MFQVVGFVAFIADIYIAFAIVKSVLHYKAKSNQMHWQIFRICFHLFSMHTYSKHRRCRRHGNNDSHLFAFQVPSTFWFGLLLLLLFHLNCTYVCSNERWNIQIHLPMKPMCSGALMLFTVLVSFEIHVSFHFIFCSISAPLPLIVQLNFDFHLFRRKHKI